MKSLLRAPFPWFGGKSRAAAAIWEGLGDVANYVEPFAGSLAVLLGRPTPARTETVNDLDCYVANFWRALQGDPEGLAAAADWPVNEADLHARHRWLVEQGDFREKMRRDPAFFDVRIAGWWVWGLSAWIGGGWCATATQTNGEVPSEQAKRPQLMTSRGVHRLSLAEQLPAIGVSAPGNGSSMKGIHRASLAGDVWQQRPQVSTKGQGVHKRVLGTEARRPAIGGREGRSGTERGVHKLALRGNGHGVGVNADRCSALLEEFDSLAARLRAVRVCCGDWKRVLTPSVTTGHGLTGVVLDPPYAHDERAGNLYACESDVSSSVREWALEHGDDPLLRIVLCGYEGEHEMPASWRMVEWKASGGYGRRAENKNRHRERLWFSPACVSAKQGSLSKQGSLFAGGAP